MKHSLRFHDKDIELPSGEFVIGRAANCQLSLDDPLVGDLDEHPFIESQSNTIH